MTTDNVFKKDLKIVWETESTLHELSTSSK